MVAARAVLVVLVAVGLAGGRVAGDLLASDGVVTATPVAAPLDAGLSADANAAASPGTGFIQAVGDSAVPGAMPLLQVQALELWAIQQMGEAKVNFCWRRSYGRGAGVPLTCAAGLQEDAGLCYPQCNAGYTGVSFVCWQNCPAGFPDTGADCLKPSAYGRGAGYALWDQGKCASQNPQGCEKWGLLYYPKCRAGFHPVGCCVCSPDCPDGMVDIGVSCQKQSYTRTAGTPVSTCAGGLEKDAALCYPACRAGYYGVGPVCWSSCPDFLATDCGAGCSSTADQCAKSIFDMFASVAEFALDVVELAATDGASAAAEELAKSTIESAVKAAAKWAVTKVASELADTKSKMQAAYALAQRTLCAKFCAKLEAALTAAGVGADYRTVIVREAVNRMAQASVSSPTDAFDPLDFLEEVLPLNIGGIVKAFDNPLCLLDLLPTSCNDYPTLCTSSGRVCSASGWSCQGQAPQFVAVSAGSAEDTAGSGSSSGGGSGSSGLGAGAVAGIIAGCLAAVALALGLVTRRRRLQQQQQRQLSQAADNDFDGDEQPLTAEYVQM